MRIATRAALRALAAPLLAGLLAATAPVAVADHVSAPGCDAGDTVVNLYNHAGGFSHISIAHQSATQPNVCVYAVDQTLAAVVVLRSDTSALVPRVTTTPGTGFCTTKLVDTLSRWTSSCPSAPTPTPTRSAWA